MAGVSADKKLWIKQLSAGGTLREFQTDSKPKNVFFGLTDQYVGVLQENNSTVVFDVVREHTVAKVKHEELIDNVVFDSKGQYIVTLSSGSRSARSWLWQPEQLIAVSCDRLRASNESEWDNMQWVRLRDL